MVSILSRGRWVNCLSVVHKHLKGLNLAIIVPTDVLALGGARPSAGTVVTVKLHIDGLVQDCSNSSMLAMELLQSCTKSSICLDRYKIRLSLWMH